MHRQKAEIVVEEILGGIERGLYSVGQPLPAEADLASRYEVSRLTVREAVKHLASRGVLDVSHGRRNRIAPAPNWSLLDPDIAILRGKLTGNETAWALDLMEARRIVETGTVELAATRISSDQLQAMQELLERMDAGGSVTEIVQADMDFHRLILEAANNSYLTATYESLEAILRSIRLRTSASARVREEAQHWHRAIHAALAQGDPAQARAAMENHMQQTIAAVRQTLTTPKHPSNPPGHRGPSHPRE